MSVARNNAAVFALILALSVFSLTLYGCEDPGAVGGGFTDPGTEVTDTSIYVSDVSVDSFFTYSGNLTYFSAGEFNDPLFGDLRAISLLKPSLPVVGVADSLSSGSYLSLQLALNDSSMYGDTLSTAQFDIVELGEIWRGRAWEIDDEVPLTQNVIGSFQVGQETDSLVVPLAQEWSSRYRAFYNAISANRDSLYRYDFHGLALVPRNEAKIIPFNSSQSRFFVIDPLQEDTSFVTGSQWGYSLERSGSAASPTGSSEVISTYEKVMKLDLDLSRESLGTVNISKVELLVYLDQDNLDSSISQVSNTAVRPPLGNASLFVSDPQNLPEAFAAGSPIANGTFDEAAGAFRFDISRYANSILVEGASENDSFYVTFETNDGMIRSGLFFNNQGPEEKRPRLVVTYINTKGN